MYQGLSIGHLQTSLFAMGLFYYPILGMALSIFMASIVSFPMALFERGKLKIGLGIIYFSGASASLISPWLILHIISGGNQFLHSSKGYFAITNVVVIITGISILAISYLLITLWKAIPINVSKIVGIIFLSCIVLGSGIYLSVPPEKQKEVESFHYTKDANVAVNPDIFLIVIDCLRYDCISGMGQGVSTPHLKRLIDDGIFCKKAFAQCSWTKPSIASILTSLYVSQHNVLTNLSTINPQLVTLAEVLKEREYYNCGFHNNVHLRNIYNFDQGFHHYEYFGKEYPIPFDFNVPRLHFFRVIDILVKSVIGGETYVGLFYKNALSSTERIIKHVDSNADRDMFVFVHYMDPHAPYFRHPFDGTKHDPPPTELTDTIKNDIFNTYKQEIQFTDSAVGMLLQELDKLDMYDESLIILTADHGEEFLEHGGWEHARTLYNELIHVPLIIKLPENRQANNVDSSLVQLIDIAPTITSLVGAHAPGEWEGIDLMSDEIRSWVYAEKINGKTILTHDDKLYVTDGSDVSLPTLAYFDLKEDYDESANLADDPAYEERIRELDDSLRSIELRLASTKVESFETELDFETREQLKALGYLD
ncbi:MAG: sulfatase-like hydrolase/transferase [candidate division Zixibacteria bacterium]|nr:sulfatase-like hydrolase/transferase [candidate division Zixibacteria bacterium]